MSPILDAYGGNAKSKFLRITLLILLLGEIAEPSQAWIVSPNTRIPPPLTSHHLSFPLFARSKLDETDMDEIHKRVREMDPEWYEQNVLQRLGQKLSRIARRQPKKKPTTVRIRREPTVDQDVIDLLDSDDEIAARKDILPRMKEPSATRPPISTESMGVAPTRRSREEPMPPRPPARESQDIEPQSRRKKLSSLFNKEKRPAVERRVAPTPTLGQLDDKQLKSSLKAEYFEPFSDQAPSIIGRETPTLDELSNEQEEAARMEGEQARLAAEQKAQEEAEAIRLSAEKLAAEMAAAERKAREEAEAEKLETERKLAEAEAARIAAEQKAQEIAEAARLASQQAEGERKAREEAEAARIEAEKKAQEEVEAARIAAEQKAREEAEAAKVAAEKKAKEEAEAARIAAEKKATEEKAQREAEAARIAAEQAEAEKKAREEAEAAKVTAERKAQEEAEAARVAAEKQAAEEKAQQEAEAARIAAEQAEAEKKAREEAEAAKIAAERKAQEEAEAARVAAEKKAQEDAEEARIAAEQAEAERKAREEVEAQRLAAAKNAQEEAEAARVAAEKKAQFEAEAARTAAEQAEAEKKAQMKAEAAGIAAEEKARKEAEAARCAAEQATVEAKAREDAEAARFAAEKKAQERAEATRIAAEEQAREVEAARIAAEKKAKEDANTARIVAEKKEQEEAKSSRIVAEQAEAKRKAREAAEAARLAAEKKAHEEADAVKMTTKNASAEAEAIRESKKASIATDGSGVALYRDMQGQLQMVPMVNITKLGYSPLEVAKLERVALSIIVEDNVPRPKAGVPSQWKVRNSDSESGVIFAATVEEAERIIQSDLEAMGDQRAKRRQRMQPDDLEKRSSEPTLGKDSRSSVRERKAFERREAPRSNIETGGTERLHSGRVPLEKEVVTENGSKVGGSQKPRGIAIDDQIENGPRPRPESKYNQGDVDTRRRQQNRGPVTGSRDDDRIRSRAKRGDDKSRRIYDARRPLNGRSPPDFKPDPPAPQKFWPDMNTFRNLLRSEAELRLRILGSDWEKTVRQESEWRLDLYKQWLWTLHNGVGDSIVPPSRYERARRTQLSSEDKGPRRDSPKSDSETANRNKRGRDRRSR